jgi:PadR family transcriptional regulator PadR
MLLATIRLRPNAYGLAIRDELLTKGGRDVSIGTIYAALERLNDKGFIDGKEGEPEAKRGGRRKMLFTVTGLGSRALQSSLQTSYSLLEGITEEVFA